MKNIRLLPIAMLLCFGTSPAHAQRSGFWQSFLPRVHYFQPLVADPLEPRMSLALLQTNVFERAGEGRERPPFTFPDPEDAATDVNVAAGIGGSIPLLQLKEWPGKGGIVASAQLGVFSRFRIEYPSRDDVGQDWFVGMPFEVSYEKFTGRFRIMHRSSHIGDELVEVTGARRIEFGGEYADFLAGYHVLHGVRVYGGGTWNFRSYTERLPVLQLNDRHDTFQMQAGIDGHWFRTEASHSGLTAGIDWQSAQRTGWRSQFSAAAGWAARVNGQGTKLLLRYFHGPSPMGEFFLTPETFWAAEWVVEF
ncbi:MAG TPA: DUF1207 domain-containing protein [Longimicrobiales bacterium]|nr:DUF1207 domain-containing protein [Longimicrobiales bacterium]